ncbi:MAG: NADH-quinone oxidoreductase subunit L [Elusimicrobia bacterium]|nr:NADH-quinone oxidoreductase subunit L [Elusimicrobiota bacterium]
MLEHAYLIALIPFLAAHLIFFFGRFLPLRGASLGIAAISWGFLHSAILWIQGLQHSLPLPYESAFPWFRFGVYQVEIGVYLDGLTLSMLLVVTLVSLMVQIYSLGYLRGDARFKRYYAYLSLFTASMLGLVIANNLLFFFMCWELVGLCSYLLIGFWFEKPEAAGAGRKAFLTTKFGDLGFFIGLLLAFAVFGTFRFSQIQLHIQTGQFSGEILLVIALLFFCGAIGKSAQFPLFVWLPDAMEGPTPVSALIHAATMVAAGVYLVARTYFLYLAAPGALQIVALFGAGTAFLAATMALVPNDIKRVLAFSTISQLGYMMLALGVGGYATGMFHLTTHAFFKALLFLGAGSIIHAVHTNDIQKMGGLSRKMPITFLAFLAGSLALAGIPPFSGFFSKDAILLATFESGVPGLDILALCTAALTAFYTFRLCFLVFFGSPRDPDRFAHAQESPQSMTIPMLILAVLAFSSGYLLEIKHAFASLVAPHLPQAHPSSPALSWKVPLYSTALAIAGIYTAAKFYAKPSPWPEYLRYHLRPVQQMLLNRYGLDAFYLWMLRGADRLAEFLYRVDFFLLDQAVVDGFGRLALQLSRIKNWVDNHFVDAAVDWVGKTTCWAGRGVRTAQTGLVQNYMLFMALTVSVLLVTWLTL